MANCMSNTYAANTTTTTFKIILSPGLVLKEKAKQVCKNITFVLYLIKTIMRYYVCSFLEFRLERRFAGNFLPPPPPL